MARGFLTGLDSTFNRELGQSVSGLAETMLTGVGQLGAGIGGITGNEALSRVDFRPERVKLKERFAQLTGSKDPNDRQELLQIMGKMGASPDVIAKYQMQFAAEDKAEDLLTAQANKQTNIRNAVVTKIKDNPLYADVLPAIESGLLDDNPEELVKLLKTEPTKGKKLTRPFAGTTPDGKPVMLTIQSKEGRDDQIVDLEGNPPPAGTILTTKDGTKVEVNLNDETASKFEEELGKQLATDIIDSRKTAMGSLLTADTLNSQWGLVDGNLGIIAGTGTDIKLGVGKALSALGLLSGEGEELVANTEAFLANAGNLVAEVITKFGSGTGLSDKDLEFAKKMAAADSSVLTEDGIRRILRLQARAIQRKVEIHNRKVANSPARSSTYDMTVQVPEFPWAALQPNEEGYKAPVELSSEVNFLLDKYSTGTGDK